MPRLRIIFRPLALWLAFAACSCVLWRYQLINKFSILHGDRYDMVIVVTILEHWFHVFRGEAWWSDVGYFYPYARTIANTDAYFFVGVAYFPLRFAGLDPFLAAELAGVVLKAAGFFGAWWMSRRVFSLSYGWSLLFAVLFTLSNGMTAHGQRLQLATVALAPVMATMLWIALTAFLAGDAPKFRWFGAASGLMFGAWCLTCFYMAWFFCFFTTVLLGAAVVAGGVTGLKQVITALRAGYLSLIFVLLVTMLAMMPFIYAFLPKSAEVGVRPYESVAANTIPLENVLQVGSENLLFGRLYNAVLAYVSPAYVPIGEYYNTGISPVLFFLFFCGAAITLCRWRDIRSSFLVRVTTVATLLVWGSAISVQGWSAWYYVYQWFPGARALNVISTIQIFLALPVLVVAVRYLSFEEISKPILVLLVGLLLVGELNKSYQMLDRQRELERIKLLSPPPVTCKAFYVSAWKEPGDTLGISSLYAHNVSAMLIAQFAGIPTLNGFASFNPKDWVFGFPNDADYDARVLAYASKHDVQGLCKLNLNTKEWSWP